MKPTLIVLTLQRQFVEIRWTAGCLNPQRSLMERLSTSSSGVHLVGHAAG